MHPWIGAGAEDRARILAELGKGSVDELFLQLPESVRVDAVGLPTALDEASLLAVLEGMAGQNVTLDDMPSFLGAGVYRHVQPAAVDAVLSRAEFFTSYTPYQPEISQGTLQAIFEFQTIICQLTGLGAANASLYDGATAVVEAALMAHRIHRGRRNRILVAETVHPVYRRVLDTYAGAVGLAVGTVVPSPDARVDVDALAAAVSEDVCGVIVQSPNFLGVVEDLPAVAKVAQGCGAIAVQVVAEAASFGVLLGGGELGFDIVCGEAQSFGIPPGFGGPHLGFFASRGEYVRQMPGRLVGETVDGEGRRAFCLTLSTREQHIRRAKATSNICTNHGLMALAATVWLELLGGNGLTALGRSCLSRAVWLRERIGAVGGGWQLAYPDSPVFNEMLVLGPGTGPELVEQLAREGVLGGVPSRLWGGSWPDGVLIAVTERSSVRDLEALVAAMGRVR
jgi:glycine cleavage system P protein (glycine dehydrogenase) subunit 1